jgi:hypothetical protein
MRHSDALVRSTSWQALAALLLACGVASAQPPADTGVEFFERQVRPILAGRCFGCHSGKLDPGIKEPKGNLRLDSREAMLQGGDTGPAIVPGKPAESLLIDAINYGELYQMPPKSKLPAEEIAALTKWVELGARWPQGAAEAEAAKRPFDLAARMAEHWCWQPLKAGQPPPVRNAAWPRQPLDRFILARLEEKGIAPAPPADKRTLIRRAYFDLIGLPPPPEKVESFVRDDSPQAFERVVDELLASPHFGERWGRHWLDLVRYAETRGHEFDYAIPGVYHYRDYVIRALNADVPYNQFVIEHVAGDLLESPRRHPSEGFNESILGTGFWFFGEWVHSPVDIRKDETDRVDNMIDVFSKTFLGLTVSCARCHDHKFDAISQEDYYALCGYVYSSSYRLARFDTMLQEREQAAALGAVEAKHRPKVAALVAQALRTKLDVLAKALADDAATLQRDLGTLVRLPTSGRLIADYTRAGGAEWMTDGPMFGTGIVPAGTIILGDSVEQPIVEIAAYGAARRESAFAGLALSAGSENDPGRLATFVRGGRTLKTKTFRLERGKLHYLVAGAGNVYAVVDSHAMINGPLHGQLVLETGNNGDAPLRWVTHDLTAYVGHRVHIEFTPKNAEDLHVLAVVEAEERPALEQEASGLVAKIAKAEPAAARIAAAKALLTDTLELLAADKLAACDNPVERAQVAGWMVSHPAAAEGITGEARKELELALAAYRTEREKVSAQIRLASRVAPAIWDGSGQDENLLIRGNPRTPGPLVPRRLLAAMAGSGPGDSGSACGSGRLELARRLVSGENPFPARVMVNRIWHHLLGRGIVPSTDNFGVLGQAPTHPELLDYLAAQFMEEGWSIKRTIRAIMLSSTYQMSSETLRKGVRERETGERGEEAEDTGQETAAQVDPQNLLFHRANIKRLEGEAIRDAILAVSGRLDRTQFGPSVPIHLTPFMQGRGRPAESGPLDGSGRRSIYIAVRRNFLSPMMLAFDMPPPLGTVGRRNVSNVPAQALILMNDPFVIEQARHWARRILAEPNQTPQQRIERMYLEAFSRPPTDAQLALAVEFLKTQSSARTSGETNLDRDEDTWADFAHVLYNAKEFVFVR